MDVESILAELRQERDRMAQAISVLEELDGTGKRRTRKPMAVRHHPARKPKQLRRISAAGRKRLSGLMKKRWAERKKNMKAKRRPKPPAAEKKETTAAISA